MEGSKGKMNVQVRRLVETRNALGEGPLWDPVDHVIYWVDILDRTVWRADANGGNARDWSVPAHIGALALRHGGGAVVALSTGFHALDFETGLCTPITDPEAGNTRTRFNDGKVDRRGRFFAGTMDYQETEGLGSLYRLDPDMTCTKLDQDIVVFNAPCWSPDDRTFYFADSAKGVIYANDYDIETGTISNRRVFPTADDAPGVPDGCTVDGEGHLWNARWGAGCVVRFSPDGRVDRIIEIPARKTTSCTFGGLDLDLLYVTSMKDPDNPKDPNDPDAGSIYVLSGLGVRGLPEPRFAG
jgi:sugar lactone lactonase YvrE